MRSFIRFILVSMILLVGSLYGNEQDASVDFDKMSKKFANIRYPAQSDYQEITKDFLNRHRDQQTIDMLGMQALNAKHRKLALVCLAQLAGEIPAAREVLLKLAEQQKGQDVIIAISYLPVNQTCMILKEISRKTIKLQTRKAALELLKIIWNESLFEQYEKSESQYDPKEIKKALKETMSNFGLRPDEFASETPKKSSTEDMLFWRAYEETRGSYRSPFGHEKRAAEIAHKWKSKFSRDFLETKLNKKDPLAIILIGRQKEQWAVEKLKSFVNNTGNVGYWSRTALAQIGSRGALFILEGLLVDGLSEPNQQKRQKRHVIKLLERYGDQESSDRLLRLAGTEENKEEKDRLNRAAHLIQYRLQKQPGVRARESFSSFLKRHTSRSDSNKPKQ